MLPETVEFQEWKLMNHCSECRHLLRGMYSFPLICLMSTREVKQPGRVGREGGKEGGMPLVGIFSGFEL